MTYQQAGRVAIIKRLCGWVLFIPALLSTLISLLSYVEQYGKHSKGISAVITDFIHIFYSMLRYNSSFLNVFWEYSPVPSSLFSMSVSSVFFWVIYWVIFVGVSLHNCGTRMGRQVIYVRENLDNQMIIEQAKGNDGLQRSVLESKINMPNHSIFLQFFSLYISPLIVAAIVFFSLTAVGLI